MAAANSSNDPLVVSNKSSDSPIEVQLHPLTLLTISDYITRHEIRKQEGAIVGAVIGQQTSRLITLEHAFQVKTDTTSGQIALDAEWFEQQLEAFKQVHKNPGLDLVAIFTLGSTTGPQPDHVPIVQQAREIAKTDSIMLLLFHPQLVDNLQGGRLPITLYQSVEELDGDAVQLKFSERAFEVETGDAEMIGVDFVAKGGSAAAVQKSDTAASSAARASKAKSKKGKGNQKDTGGEEDTTNDNAAATAPAVLSPEDEELIASLSAKVNAIKMLHERINIIRSYLTTLPDSTLTDASSTTTPPASTDFQVLRSINAMLSRLSLLAPPTPSQTSDNSTSQPNKAHSQSQPSLLSASEREKEDVYLTALLAGLTRSINEATSLGSKLQIVQREKHTIAQRTAAAAGGRASRFGGMWGGTNEEAIMSEMGP